jgi:hypothetical protein
MLQSGIIEKSDVLKSLHAYKALSSILAQNGTLVLEKPLNDIFAMIDAYLAPMLRDEIDEEEETPSMPEEPLQEDEN